MQSQALTPPLEVWGEEQARISSRKLAAAISATSLVKERPGFGQKIRPAKGSVLASPSLSLAEGEPDYFFHWLRDSAVVMEAARLLALGGEDADTWRQRFFDMVGFAKQVAALNGEDFLAAGDFTQKVAPDYRRWLRKPEDIAAVKGEAVLSEVRYNADGTLDITHWSRPQFDGAALRALVTMRFFADQKLTDDEAARLISLIQADLAYTAHHAGLACYDIWEEEVGRSYYTSLVQYAALRHGADFFATIGASEAAADCEKAARALLPRLDDFWSTEKGIIRSKLDAICTGGVKDLDFQVIFGVLHAALPDGPHSVHDDKVLATLRSLEALFGRLYAINKGLTAADGLAYGRYEGDCYVSGGAYHFSTLGAAEFYYRRAQKPGGAAKGSLAIGDAILNRLRAHVPASGELSEQYDQTTGAQTSARDLSWGYAAFLTAWQARKKATAAASS